MFDKFEVCSSLCLELCERMNGCVFHAEDSLFYLVVKECYLRELFDRRYSIVVLKEEYRNHLSRIIEI